jgi:hypothetical protein
MANSRYNSSFSSGWTVGDEPLAADSGRLRLFNGTQHHVKSIIKAWRPFGRHACVKSHYNSIVVRYFFGVVALASLE